MFLTHLSLTNFRSFARLDLDIPRRVVLLTGSNAQGKTSVLEAVYFLAAFTSFQTHADRQLVNFLEAKKELGVGRLVAEYKRGPSKHRLEVRLVLEAVGATSQRLRKEILLDGIKRPMSEVIGHFNAVIFVPQMSQIIEGGPEERRRYLNLALAQTVPGYAHLLSEYGQALTQRNALLKTLSERGGDQSQLDFWDETITRAGATIILRRIEAVHEIEKLAARIHRDLTHASEVLRIHYLPAYDPLPSPNGQIAMPLKTTVQRNGFSEEDIRQGFALALKNNRAEDIRRGVTVLGPHRDELRFLANGIDLSDFGSRGQVRTTLLALKLAEVEWMKARTGQWPVLLLDEVLAELDTQRRLDLLASLEMIDQALLTTTDLKLFSNAFIEKTEKWEVSSGTVKVLNLERKVRMVVKHVRDVESQVVKTGEKTTIQVLISAQEGPNFAMRRFVMEPGGGMPNHTNTVEHEQYVLKGYARIGIGDREFDVQPGDVVFIPGGEPHWYRNLGEDNFEFLCLIPNKADEIKLIGKDC